jgi:intein/homing endonuclease
VNYKTTYQWATGARVPRSARAILQLRESGKIPSTPTERTARLVGFLHGDGCLSKNYRHFDFISTNRASLDRITEDLGEEFDITPKLRRVHAKGDLIKLPGREGHAKEDVFMLTGHSKIASCILHVLGVPIGRKTTQSYRVPAWIRDGPLAVKRGFLQGLFDAELASPQTNPKQGNGLLEPQMVLAKRKDFEENLKDYLRDVSGLLAAFGVESKIRYARYYDEDRVAITLHILCRSQNMLRFIGRIGFYYNPKKSARLQQIHALILEKQKA